jgi:hypothetical protein
MMAAVAQSPVPTGAAAPNKSVHVKLWLPVTPLFWLLSPFALLLAPFVWICIPPAQRPRNPFAPALAIGGILVSLGGTIVDVEAPGSTVFIRIY